ncbi:GAF domain-containing protein [Pedobacter sp. GR22-6]|uniref:GAF domain-containing protein n=1 Tax=Pedobacter sp. GR22-6 TaxID=3127957 RepID=UPI00307DAC8C
MTIKKNFDSDFCGSLPLHHINSIQDYGYVLVVETKGLMIVQASENLAGLFHKDIQEIIPGPLAQYLEEASTQKIKELIKSQLLFRIPLSLSLKQDDGSESYHALVHIKTDYLIIELEKSDQSTSRSFTEVYESIRHIGAALDKADTVQEVCDTAITELRKLSGFDGILMYSFDKEWNGTVISEDKDERLEQYLGQTFPASDVPRQAREMYLKNPYRLIPNRNYQPIRLYPVINPVTNAFIDLSDCNLRGVAAVHLEYMKNMGIKASMSIRVIYNQSLWGLISCHHIDEKYLNYEICSVFEWLSELISNRLSMVLNQESHQESQSLHLQRQLLSDRIYTEDQLMAVLLAEDAAQLLSLFKASGVVVSQNGRIESRGLVPPKDELENLLLWLEGKSFNKVFSTSQLSEDYEDAAAFAAEVSGLLFIPIDSERAEFVVCFRPEVLQDINWGGDPNQTITFDQDGKNYHPRNSFTSWKETVREHALSWRKEELEVAESLRTFLFEFRTRQLKH